MINKPRILVFTTVYPNRLRPNFGVFIHERMKRVAELTHLEVLAPIPTVPLLGRFRQNYRNGVPLLEYHETLKIQHCPFYMLPGVAKFLDGCFLYLSSLKTVAKIRRSFRFDLIDAHFAYPDGFAAVLLAKHFGVPVTITLRGTLNRLINYHGRRQAIRYALSRADRVFSVSGYLAELAQTLGLSPERFIVVPNGVDVNAFLRLDKDRCRNDLGIEVNRKVLVSVGALAERKGHHRVVESLPELIKRNPELLYLIVGGGSVEGDMGPQIRGKIREYGLEKNVRLVGEVAHDQVKQYLSAADVFVLATRYEGWANVFLEAMACGLPVVTTRVCGNPEVVQVGKTGLLVPFGDREALKDGLIEALERAWDNEGIINYAKGFTWERAAERVYAEFEKILKQRGKS